MNTVEIRILNTQSNLVATFTLPFTNNYPEVKKQAEAEAQQYGPIACPSNLWAGVLRIWVKQA